ncbi:MAG: TetR/AcrR family transcriptional regulator [Deltaproteobacteria bacterium]|nr:TetR/AcrR family transcriptional regulator [Deltaproteobacteria bacterium]
MAKSARQKRSESLRSAIERQKRAVYREGILDAASRVFSRLGFSDAKMVDIASESGVSVGTLYNYFQSKDEVVSSLGEHETREFRSRIASVESVEDPLERIQKVLLACCRFIEEHGALMQMGIRAGLMRSHGAAHFPDSAIRQTRRYMLKLYEKALTQAVAQGAVRSDLPPGRLALIFDGMLNALIFEWVGGDRKRSLSEQSGFLFDLFMKGAKAR